MKIEKKNGKLNVYRDAQVFDIVTPKDAMDIVERLKKKGMTYKAIASAIGVTVQSFASWRKTKLSELKASTQVALRLLEEKELQ